MANEQMVWQSENEKWVVYFIEGEKVRVCDVVKRKSWVFDRFIIASLTTALVPNYVRDAILEAIKREKDEGGFKFAVQYQNMHTGIHGLLVYDSREDVDDATSMLNLAESGALSEDDYSVCIETAITDAFAQIEEIDYRQSERFMYGFPLIVNDSGHISTVSEDICIVNSGRAIQLHLS